MGKKRGLQEENINGDEVHTKKSSSNGSDVFDELYNEVTTAPVIDLELLGRLHQFLVDNKDDKTECARIGGRLTQKFITSLLVSYTATRTETACLTYDVLLLLEKTYSVNLSVLKPLVWGEKSRDHYEKLKSLGSTLHRISPNQVLTYFDGVTLWKTVRSHSNPNCHDVYDVRFVLRLFATIVHPGSELSCRQFVDSNCLSLVFSCTSSKDHSTRVLAYYVLQKYLSLLQELKEEQFAERSLFLYVIRLFKQSLESETPRISHMISHFFARVCKLLLHPESPVYSAILSFICLKPQIDLNNVPEFYKLFFSSSVEHYKAEREWILTHVSEALVDPVDYNVLQNRSGMKLLQSVFCSCLSDQTSRKLILAAMKACVSMPSVAHDLFHRCNFHSWIASAIQASRLTRWEQNYLAQIFCLLLTNERKFNRNNVADPTIALLGAKIAAKPIEKVLRELKESEPISTEHLNEIHEILGQKWRKKKRKARQPLDAESI